MTIVVSGFPGVGKSYACDELSYEGYNVKDMDSSEFDREAFPDNYLNEIEVLLKKKKLDVLFVSCHEEVRRGLENRGIKYVLVYPEEYLKAEYIRRYVNRGSSEMFVSLLDDNWTDWIEKLEHEEADELKTIRVIMDEDDYVLDIVREFLD